MSRRNKPIVINLIKVSNGYQFESSRSSTNEPNLNKNTKTQNQKNSSYRLSTRLIKEISQEGNLPELSQEPLPNISNQPIEEAPLGNNLQEEQEEILIQIKREIELPPRYAKWFNFEDIHEIQKFKLPEFFNGKTYKNPDLYLKWRNFIVNLYNQNPNQYLTKIACRRILRGDANAICRVHQFLQNQGIINFGLAVQGSHTFNSSFINKNYELHHIPQSNIHSVPNFDQPLHPSSIDNNNLTFSIVNKSFSRTYRVYCSKCQLICGICWYTKNTQEDSNLCFQCYNILLQDNKQKYEKIDIVQKMNSFNLGKQPNKKSNWTIDDNIKLLEFMGNSQNKNWKQTIEYFEGKKTIQDIALQFMQFPITNFNPTQQQTKQKQKSQIKYSNQQHIKILQNFYNKSEYKNGQTIKYQLKTNQQQIQCQESNTSKLIKLVLLKYLKKIQHQKLIEETIQKNKEKISRIILRKQNNKKEEVYKFDSIDDDSIFQDEGHNYERNQQPLSQHLLDSSYALMLNLSNSSLE